MSILTIENPTRVHLKLIILHFKDKNPRRVKRHFKLDATLMTTFFAFILLSGCFEIKSQSLFESATDNNSQEKKNNYELNGFIRGLYYFGENEENRLDTKSGYGEAALKILIDKEKYGKAYADIRYRSGFEYGNYKNELSVKEAYVNTRFFKILELSVGQQIIAWGRADGINPTDIITPKNYILRTPDYDDTREGNFIINPKLNLSSKLTVSGIFIPVYKSHVISFDIAELPDEVAYKRGVTSEGVIENSSYAVKVDFIFPGFDGSLSYFNGYALNPGLVFGTPVYDTSGNYQIDILSGIYKHQMIGCDFSTSVNKTGLRGEIAYKITKQYKNNNFIPFPETEYVIGFDRVFNNFSITGQY